MTKVNHIMIIENFFNYLNDRYHCGVDLENKYPISLEKKMLDNVRFSKSCSVFIRTSLPYKVERLKSGSYIFLNREYKPLGIFDRSWGNLIVDYEQFEFLSFEYKKTDIHNIYFRGDRNKPEESRKDFIEYLIRLKYFLIDYKNGEVRTDYNGHHYAYSENIF